MSHYCKTCKKLVGSGHECKGKKNKSTHINWTLDHILFAFSLLLIAAGATNAFGGALTTAQSFGTNYNDQFRIGQPSLMLVKGSGTNTTYVLEADPTTGALPVSGTFSLGLDTNWGAVGATTLRAAAELGNASGLIDFGSGASSAQTIRVIPATDAAVPSGAATSALQVTGNATLVTLKTGRSSALLYRNNYASVAVTTTAYVQVIASTSSTINRLCIFDSSGSAMKVAVGGSGSEVDQLYVPPGGSSQCFELTVPVASRIALEALDVNATNGQIIMTGLN